jgi:hypothetical protein
VQFFSTHRVPEAHSWERAENGVLQRRVRYVGDSAILEESGDPSEIEKRLGLVELTEDRASEVISEETVMHVAEAWSLNPQELATTPTRDSLGTYGELAVR